MIIRMMKSKKRWADHVAGMGIIGTHAGNWWDSQKD
jgi:hypothetical protein